MKTILYIIILIGGVSCVSNSKEGDARALNSQTNFNKKEQGDFFNNTTLDNSIRKIYGKGLIKVNFSESTILKFYQEIDDKDIIRELIFFNDTSTNSWSIMNLDIIRSEWFNPFTLDLDYSNLLFQCVETANDNWYRVILDENSNSSLWLNSEDITYFNWESYLMDANIDLINIESSPLRILPIDTSKIVYLNKDYKCLNVESVMDEWIKINSRNEYCQINVPHDIYTRWRREDTLLIYFLK